MAGQLARDVSPSIDLDVSVVPDPDMSAEPDGFVVEMAAGERIHFLDWGGSGLTGSESAPPPVLLIHGLAQTAWVWAPVARRLRRLRRVVAMDLRGHGLSDSPTHGYEPAQLAEDAMAVADGAGLLGMTTGIVLAGHGAGAMVAAWTASALGERCAGLVLVDGGWEALAETSELEPDEFLRALEEPPEVLSSMASFLADRASFGPPTWDADQERAARATVVAVPAGKVVPAVRPHVVAAFVETMFTYRPGETLAGLNAPVVALMAADDELGHRAAALGSLQRARAAAGMTPIPVARFPADGHNLMRYRPLEVAATILTVTERD